MSVHQTKDGRHYSRFRKGRHPTNPNKTREYFGRGEENRVRAVSFDLSLDIKKKQSSGKYFIDIVNAWVRVKANNIRQNSVDTAYTHLHKHLIPFFGNTDIANITDERLDEYVHMRSTQKWNRGNKSYIGVSKTTIRRELTTLQSVLNWAAKRKYITHNPAQHHEKPHEDTEDVEPLTQSDFNTMYLHAAPHLKRFMMLAIFTSARPGASEVLKLKWDNVDFLNGTIYVISAKKKGPKRRTVPLHPTLYKNLEAWYEADLLSRNSTGFIVHYRGKPIKSIRKSWETAKKKSKILKKITPYCIRHSSITNMLEAGADLKSVSMIAGHSNTKMTTDRYQHASDGLRKRAINGLPDFGNTVITRKPGAENK